MAMQKVIEPPEFSEFSFGFTVTNGLVHFRSGSLSPWPTLGRWWRRWRGLYPPFADKLFIQGILVSQFGLTQAEAEAVTDACGAPFIPTQHLEKSFPIDVALASDGIFYFLQFKRSYCVTAYHSNLLEVLHSKFTGLSKPFFRVNFYNQGDRDQRSTLELLEKSLSGVTPALVRYAVPGFHKLSELSRLHQHGLATSIDGRPPVMCFRASKFSLPGPGKHHISYDGAGTGWRFSSEPEEVLEIKPLVSELNELSEKAEALPNAIHRVLKVLDTVAIQLGLPERPQTLDDGALVQMFGLTQSRSSDDEPGLAFLLSAAEGQSDVATLASGIRKILKGPVDERVAPIEGMPTPMEFLEDLYGADFRCRQITGQPLWIGVRKIISEDV